MDIEFDPAKRDITLRERGLDFAHAVEVFRLPTLTWQDERFVYGETRYTTFGYLADEWVIVVWTPRGAARRIISMRKANEREITKLAHRVG